MEHRDLGFPKLGKDNSLGSIKYFLGIGPGLQFGYAAYKKAAYKDHKEESKENKDKLLVVFFKDVFYFHFSLRKIVQEALAVCCASTQNRIKIHESEFLYLANCISSPDYRDFLHEYAKNPQVQQAARNLSFRNQQL
jgi:hypothetical protein